MELVHVRVSVDRQSGEPREPVLVEATTTRGSTRTPERRCVITTPAFAARPAMRKRNTRSGPRSIVVTPTPLGVSG